MEKNNHDHLHESYSISNGQRLQEADAVSKSTIHTNHTSNNNSSESLGQKGGHRTKNHANLDRLHTQNLQSLRPSTTTTPSHRQRQQQGDAAGTHDDVSDKDYSPQRQQHHHSQKKLLSPHHTYNPRKKRPTNSALTTSICSTVEAVDYTSISGISRIIHRHFSRVDYVRSDEQLEKEKYLIGKIKFSRWVFLPAAFFFQGVCGTLYAWSVFNNLIDNALYGTADGAPTVQHMAAITFYVALGCFGVSSSTMGPWLERHGPRKAGLLGAVLILIGNLITAVGIHVKHISLVYFGYGIFGGLGLGISYISPVSALQKWFPDRRGVAAGLAVSGFGAGSIALAKIPDPLSAAVGLPMTFVILGCSYFIVMAICSFVFRVPPPGYVVNGLDVWAVPVDIESDEENDNNELQSVKTDNLNLAKGGSVEPSSLFSNPSSGGAGAGIGFNIKSSANDSHYQSLHPLHPLQQAGPRKSMDDSVMTPNSPISVTATVVPSASLSMNTSRRNSTRSAAARTGYDPSISISLMDAFHSREFRLMYIMFLGNTMAGVVIISRLANIATDIFGHSKDNASTIVSINGGFNLVGRLVFASLSDKIGRKNSYMIMLGSQVIILACLPLIMRADANWAFLTTVWILTACYGGGFGCIPAFLCDMFGPSNIGPLHGVILTSWSLSSVGAGLLFTAVYNHLLESGYTIHDTFIYTVNLHWILAGVALGFLVTLFVRTGIRDRLLPSIPGEFFHSRIFGRILRFGTFGCIWVTQAKEQQEWDAYVVQRQLEEEQGLEPISGRQHQMDLEKERALDREERAAAAAALRSENASSLTSASSSKRL